MTHVLERFGTTALPSFNSSQDVGTGPAQTAYSPLSSGGAFDLLGSEQAQRADVPLNYAGQVWASTRDLLASQVRSLRALFGKRDKLYRREDASLPYTGDVSWMWARATEIPIARAANTPGKLLDLAIAFITNSRVWNGTHHGAGWNWNTSGVAWDTGYAWNETGKYTLTTSPTTLTVPNAGNVSVTDAVITITSASGNITNPKVTVTGVSEFQWTGTIAAGKSLVISLAAGSVKYDGADSYVNFSLTANHFIDAWLRLDTPSTSVIVTWSGGGNGSATFDFWEGLQ